VIEWLWDHKVAVIGSDTFAVERLPPVAHSKFRTANDGAMMHQELLALMRLALGELWRLDGLAAASRVDGVHSCLLVSSQLNVVGGVSTPANAVAIR
jgi:kynurenine formamidase